MNGREVLRVWQAANGGIRLRWRIACQLSLASAPPALFAGEKLDPRAAIAGVEGPSGWQSGLFDRGSWTEAQVGGRGASEARPAARLA